MFAFERRPDEEGIKTLKPPPSVRRRGTAQFERRPDEEGIKTSVSLLSLLDARRQLSV